MPRMPDYTPPLPASALHSYAVVTLRDFARDLASRRRNPAQRLTAAHLDDLEQHVQALRVWLAEPRVDTWDEWFRAADLFDLRRGEDGAGVDEEANG